VLVASRAIARTVIAMLTAGDARRYYKHGDLLAVVMIFATPT